MKIKFITIVGLMLFGMFAVSAHDHDGKMNMYKEHFKKADSNGDSKISKEEWAVFHEGVFTKIDKDNDGMLSDAEFKAQHSNMKKETKENKKK